MLIFKRGGTPETLEFPRPIEPQARVRALGALYLLAGSTLNLQILRR